MCVLFDNITGTVYRRPLDRPVEVVAERRFGFGGVTARRAFLVPSERSDQGHISEYSVYADVNNNRRYDSRDARIGMGLVSPQFVGRYESLPVGPYGTFSASISTGEFTIANESDLVSRGVLST